MKPTVEFQILDYLSFSEQVRGESSSWFLVDDAAWKRVLEFTDTAGLSLHLLDRLQGRNDFEKLPASVQTELKQRRTDNARRTEVILRESIELNQWLQGAEISFLNLKGVLLAPDFVERLDLRVQYDYDFLVKREDLQQAYCLFLRSGYSPLHSTKDLTADHWPTLIRKTGWEWKGNYYDPAIPCGVELHFQLWDSDYELIPIRTLDEVWERAHVQPLGGIDAPTLCRVDTLLYVTLHACRHLLRNDLRLSHLYEVAFFLQHTSDESAFWQDIVGRVAKCDNTGRMITVIFELARCLFRPVLPAAIPQLIEEYLPVAARSWIATHGRCGAVHCYRTNRNAMLLHLSLLRSHASRWALLRQRLLPRHLPLPTYGVQVPKQERSLRFRIAKAVGYLGLLFQRGLFHVRSVVELSFQIPIWLIRLHGQEAPEAQKGASRYERRSEPDR